MIDHVISDGGQPMLSANRPGTPGPQPEDRNPDAGWGVRTQDDRPGNLPAMTTGMPGTGGRATR